MKTNWMKRMLCLVLSAVLLLGHIPASAFAEEEAVPPEETVAEEVTEAASEPTEVTEPETSEPTEPETSESVAEEEPSEPAEETEPEIPEVASVEEWVIPDVEGWPSDEELFGIYAEGLLYGNLPSTFGTAAGEKLTGNTKLAYDALKPVLQQIARGEVSDTSITLGYSHYDINLNGVYGDYIVDVEVPFVGTEFDSSALMYALMADLPYEMYWFDKTTGMGSSSFSVNNQLQWTLYFPVAGNYADGGVGGGYSVNTYATGAAAVSAENAQSVIAGAANLSDYEKLVYYRDYICNAVSYDWDAYEGSLEDDYYFMFHIDSWQLISVFDGNTDTNVVCEGYSKAFQYLCDLTDFAGDVVCYSVTGAMANADGSGGHMWNIVSIDGESYLVDVTNSDTGMIGQNGGLFLVGGTMTSGKYYFTIGSQQIAFAYDSNMQSLLGSDVITLSTNAEYEPPAEEADCDHAFSNGSCTKCGILGGECGKNITWMLNEATGVMTISGVGDMPYYYSTRYDFPWSNSVCRNSTKKLVVELGITSIGSEAFWNFNTLTEVVLPDSLTTIEPYAFERCESLSDIIIPNNVTYIAVNAFAYTALTHIYIPSGVVDIGIDHRGGTPFSGCSHLQEIRVDDKNKMYCDIDGVLYTKDLSKLICCPRGISGELIIPDETSEVCCDFIGCKNLVNIVFPEGITEVYSFQDCTNLESVTLPDALTSMGSFAGCMNLKSIVVPEGVTSLQNGAFSNCNSLTSIKLPQTLLEIKERAFAGCSSLTDLTIPEGVAKIGDSAFQYCSNLSAISIPNTVQIIGSSAFLSCKNLVEISIPNGVQTIYGNTFNGCSKLQSITIPASVVNIKEYAFSYCNSLADIYYTGSESQWDMIDVNSNGNTKLTKATVHYLDTEDKVESVLKNEVKLAEGTHANWIDRVILPSFAQQFYDWLEENTDGDGQNDELIQLAANDQSPKYYSYKAETYIEAQDQAELIVLLEKEKNAALESMVIAYNIFKFEHPDLPIFSNVYVTGYSTEEISNVTGKIKIEFDIYLRSIDAESFYAFLNEQEKTIETILSIVSQNMNVYDYVRFFNAYLTRNNEYNTAYSSDNTSAHKAITALIGNTGADGPVCDAYARAFKLLCDACNIPCAYILGNESKHAWNAVQMEDGNWYAVDVTWNDPVISGATSPISGYENENYMLVGSESLVYNMRFSDSHKANEDCVTNTSFYLPNGPIFSETAYIPADTLNHIEVIDKAVDVTCTESGVTEGTHCYICGEILIAQTEIAALGHSFENGSCKYCDLLGGTCGTNVNWTFDEATGTLTISGEGDMTEYRYSSSVPWSNYDTIIRRIVVEEGVTSIGKYAFYDCHGTEISLPEGITSIGDYAFYACNAAEIILPKGITRIGYDAFGFCINLVEITIPEGVTEIGDFAFYYCSALEKVTLSEDVTSIGNKAFIHCSALETIVFEGSCPAFGESVFEGVTATAYYPANNATWTADKLQNYGGNITWVAYDPEPEEVAGTVTSGNWTMSLDQVIYLNYYPTLTGWSEGYDFAGRGGVVVWTGSSNPTSRYDIEAGKPNTVTIHGMYQNAEGKWYVQTDDIFAQNLGDRVYIRPYVMTADGEYIYQNGAPYYSPAQYCYDILNNLDSDKDTRNVCAALLEYGAEAQKYFGNDSNLVTTIPSGYPNIDLSDYAETLTYKDSYLDPITLTDHVRNIAGTLTGNRSGITLGVPTLALEGAIRLSERITINGSVIDADNIQKVEMPFWTADQIAVLDTLTYENLNSSNTWFCQMEDLGNGTYSAKSDFILAKNMGQMIYYSCRITMNDGSVYRSGLGYYNVEGFISDTLADPASRAAEVCRRLAVYGEMARIRFA